MQHIVFVAETVGLFLNGTAILLQQLEVAFNESVRRFVPFPWGALIVSDAPDKILRIPDFFVMLANPMIVPGFHAVAAFFLLPTQVAEEIPLTIGKVICGAHVKPFLSRVEAEGNARSFQRIHQGNCRWQVGGVSWKHLPSLHRGSIAAETAGNSQVSADRGSASDGKSEGY